MKWKELSKRSLLHCGIFEVFAVERSNETAGKGSFVVLAAPDWVTVVPELEDETGTPCFLMVTQYRHGSGTVMTEFPAGMVEEGEDPARCAARELLEETGYKASEIIPVGVINPNPAFMDNCSHTFVARGLSKVQQQDLDPLEIIDIKIIPRSEVLGKIDRPAFGNGIMLNALYWYQQWKDKA